MVEGSNDALITFLIYTAAVFVLAVLSNRVAKGKEFAGEYFLGSRSFGVWAFTLTFAATAASGGSFMGFPALIYTHGWTLALWIAGYMVLPMVSMAIIGKRINQVARKCDALTVPEVLRGRFESPVTGLVATSLLIFFMFFYLVAQFKAGGKILSTLFAGEPAYEWAIARVSRVASEIPWVSQAEPDYLVCLIVFSVAVIVYVVYGGFRAVVWTDAMQGIVMLVGVMLMLGLALWQVGGLGEATRQMAEMTPPEHGEGYLVLPERVDEDRLIPKGIWIADGELILRVAETVVIPRGDVRSEKKKLLRITTPAEKDRLRNEIAQGNLPSIQATVEDSNWTPYLHGADQPGVYVTNPGPSTTSNLGFLAIGSAISFFVFWPFAAAGQPSNMIRLLSFKDSRTLRYSVVSVAVYYAMIYFPLVVIFCCARVLMPGMEIDPDRAMPEFATLLTANAGLPWLAGVLVAAPFAAVMSSVDSFLLMVSSSVVRDIYQGFVDRNASERTVKILSYSVTVIVGVLAVLFVLNPPEYLQDLIVFATGGLAACFLVPMVLSLYWKRMTAASAIFGMLAGTLTHLGLTYWGYRLQGKFSPYDLLGLDPFLWDLLGSALVCVLVVWFGPKPNREVMEKFFRVPKSAPNV